MAKHKIVPITKGLPKPEPSGMGVVGGALTFSLEVDAKVIPGPGRLSPRAQPNLQPANGEMHVTAFRECAVLPQAERTYWIAADDTIGVLPAEAAMPPDALSTFSSFEELVAVTREWPMPRFVKVWNQLPGQRSVTRFENRRIAVERLWREVQNLPEQTPCLAAGTTKERTRENPTPPSAAKGSKARSIIALLEAPGGATLSALIEVTDWQAHTVRGFLSRTVSKQLGLPLQSFRHKGERTYALPSADQDAGEGQTQAIGQTTGRS